MKNLVFILLLYLMAGCGNQKRILSRYSKNMVHYSIAPNEAKVKFRVIEIIGEANAKVKIEKFYECGFAFFRQKGEIVLNFNKKNFTLENGKIYIGIIDQHEEMGGIFKYRLVSF